jgi:hypothetical protein
MQFTLFKHAAFPCLHQGSAGLNCFGDWNGAIEGYWHVLNNTSHVYDQPDWLQK